MTDGVAKVYFREFWGETKREELVATLHADNVSYMQLEPTPANRLSLRRTGENAGYAAWPSVRDLSAVSDWSGLLEKRKGALIAMSRDELESRMTAYLASTKTFAEVRAAGVGPVEDAARFDAERARRLLLLAKPPGTYRRLSILPFDTRWCFHTNVRPTWNEPRPEVAAQQARGVRFFIARDGFRRDDVGFPAYATSALPGDYLLDPNIHPLPFTLFHTGDGLLANPNAPETHALSPATLAWTASLGLPPTADTSRLVWHHALATTHTPAYLAANADALRAGWPRIPIPADREALEASATLGARLAALLDPDTPVPGVTTGDIRPELAAVAVPTTKPGTPKDWHLRAWGSRSDKGVTMPGRGSTTPRPHAPETAPHATLLGNRPGLGALDVNMNGASCWANVPEAVWDLRIGGYQVIKKWLSYRDASILDRPLTPEEVAHVRDTARRLAAILLMGPELDAAHAACAAAHTPLSS